MTLLLRNCANIKHIWEQIQKFSETHNNCSYNLKSIHAYGNREFFRFELVVIHFVFVLACGLRNNFISCNVVVFALARCLTKFFVLVNDDICYCVFIRYLIQNFHLYNVNIYHDVDWSMMQALEDVIRIIFLLGCQSGWSADFRSILLGLRVN